MVLVSMGAVRKPASSTDVNFYAPRMPPSQCLGGDRESFRENSSNKIDFAHFLDVSSPSGSRDLRGVKIPASSDAWRPSKRQNIETSIRKQFDFLGSRKSVSRHFSWILADLVNSLCYAHTAGLPFTSGLFSHMRRDVLISFAKA